MLLVMMIMMMMVVTDVKYRDSGNYTCQVRGKRAHVLSDVTHTVYVIGLYILTSHNYLQSVLTQCTTGNQATNSTTKITSRNQ